MRGCLQHRRGTATVLVGGRLTRWKVARQHLPWHTVVQDENDCVDQVARIPAVKPSDFGERLQKWGGDRPFRQY
jgi:hypothetical protein